MLVILCGLSSTEGQLMGSAKQSIAEQRQFWQHYVTQWHRRGQPRANVYCREAGVCEKQFTAWRQRLRREGWQPPSDKTATLVALEVRARAEPPPSPAPAPITIRLACGLGVEVSTGFDAPTLQAVIRALEVDDVRA